METWKVRTTGAWMKKVYGLAREKRFGATHGQTKRKGRKSGKKI